MKRPLHPEEERLWARVVAGVDPLAGRIAPGVEPAPPTPLDPTPRPAAPSPLRATRPLPAPGPASSPAWPDSGIEPNRRRRIVRGRDPVSARLDLHGLDQDRARNRLLTFLQSAQSQGARVALVVTGKGPDGQGVLRRRVPEWLADPALRAIVAGVAQADPRHGGTGALYVALKRLR